MQSRSSKRPGNLRRVRALSLLALTGLGLSCLTPAQTASAAIAEPTSTMFIVNKAINANAMWNAGYTGKGVDVAVIDTGVSPVAGLDAAGKLYNGPDLSFESQSPAHRYLDTYGHGTNMAGIIAGRDPGWTPPNSATVWSGVAPDSKILSVKVGDQSGAVDVSQVIAGIYWVIQHRKDNGLNIRVLNLSYGTDATTESWTDPLSYAVEVATRVGIVVVVSAGNSGYSTEDLNNPAQNRFVLAAGASDIKGTVDRGDDSRASFTTFETKLTNGSNDSVRNADVYVPGALVSSLAVPGSYLDGLYTAAKVSPRTFRGSGTSQAAAVLSGAAALLVQKFPTATTGQIRKLMTAACPPMQYGCAYGSSILDLAVAMNKTLTPDKLDAFAGVGTGSLNAARGSSTVVSNGVPLTGEKDIFGKTFNSSTMALNALVGWAWVGGTFNGTTWAGTTWNGNSFATATWPKSWAGTSWTDAPSTNVWSGGKWSGGKWSGGKWSGGKWSGNEWSSAGWR